MSIILTGIKPTGKPHIGNIVSVISDSIELSKNNKKNSFFFIADLHSLTTIENFQNHKNNVFEIAIT